MKESARYLKIVDWSEEDQCFVGPCCHGEDEARVYRELCQIAEEWIEIFKSQGKPLPAPTAGKNLAAKLLREAA